MIYDDSNRMAATNVNTFSQSGYVGRRERRQEERFKALSAALTALWQFQDGVAKGGRVDTTSHKGQDWSFSEPINSRRQPAAYGYSDFSTMQ